MQTFTYPGPQRALPRSGTSDDQQDGPSSLKTLACVKIRSKESDIDHDDGVPCCETGRGSSSFIGAARVPTYVRSAKVHVRPG